MKNFFKKLSFVLAIAMVLTSIAPATASAAEVVPAKKVNVKLDGEKVTSVDLDVEETKTVKIGLPVKKAYEGQKSTFKTWAEVADETVVDVNRVGNRKYELTGVAAGETTITITAAKTKKLAKAGEGVKAELTVVVNEKAAELTATQTKANQITVVGTGLTEKVADYTFKLGTATKKLEKAELQDDGSVVLTTSASYIADGTYTLTFGETTVEVPCEASKAASIVVFPDVAIMTAEDKAMAFFAVLNQFEENVTSKSTLTVNGTDVDPASPLNKGVILFNAKSGTKYNLNLSQLSIAIAEKSGVFYSGVLTVGDYSRLTSVDVKGIYKVSGEMGVAADLHEGMAEAEVDDHYLLVSGTDQYGLPFDVENINDSNLSLNLSGLTGLKVTVNDKNTDTRVVVVDDVAYAAFPLNLIDTDEKLDDGEVRMIGYVLTGGQALDETFYVGSNVKIATLKVIPSGYYYGATTAVLDYEAIDTEGNTVTDIVSLYKFNETKYFQDSKMTFVGSANGIAKLICAIDPTEVQTMKTLAWMSDTMQYGYTTLTVMPQSYPVAVVGVWTASETAWERGNLAGGNGVYLAATSGAAITIEPSDLKYEDQYGNVIPYYLYDSVVSNSGIVVSVSAINATDFATVVTATALDLEANTTFVTYTTDDVVEHTASQKILLETTMETPDGTVKKSEYKFNVSIVNLDDCTHVVKFTNGTHFYAVSTGSIYAVPAVGFAYGNVAVRTTRNQDYTYAYTEITRLVDPAAGGAVTTGEGTAIVVINNTEGTMYEVPYTTGNADAKTVFASIYYSCFGSAGYASVASNTAISMTNYLASATQYANGSIDEQYVGTPRVTISNLPTDTTAYVLEDNGTTAATIKFTKTGYYTLKVKYSWNDGFTYEEIMCFKAE